MCGLLGFSRNLQSSRTFRLELAAEVLSHRGPDSLGTFEDEDKGIGLAHTRLSIHDLSPLGNQPMFSDDGKIVLVFNGEIYNFRQIRNELRASGHHFRGHSDTEVLLRLYMECRHTGVDLQSMLSRLNGIFPLQSGILTKMLFFWSEMLLV